jgi:hypothetical protein
LAVSWQHVRRRKPLYVRPLAADERTRLAAGVRAAGPCVRRRCPILLASARGEWVPRSATPRGGADQTVRTVLRTFERAGLDAGLPRQSPRPHTLHATVAAAAAASSRATPQHSPRTVGYPTSLWARGLAAAVRCAAGLLPARVSAETIRLALKRLAVRWKRANHGITRPDPADASKKAPAAG